jgi:septal ring factor EnvC (AmiA/AmiB activator)
MNRPVFITAIVAILIGLLAGFLWWGMPSGRLQAQLRDAKASTERLEQQMAEQRSQGERLDAELKAQKVKLETAETDLRREKEMNARLNLMVSHGKK